jgi:hypothetical protein
LFIFRSFSVWTPLSTVNYAAAVALEARQPVSGGDIVLRFNFKNGTDDKEFKTYNFLNDIPLSSFVTASAVRNIFYAPIVLPSPLAPPHK